MNCSIIRIYGCRLAALVIMSLQIFKTKFAQRLSESIRSLFEVKHIIYIAIINQDGVLIMSWETYRSVSSRINSANPVFRCSKSVSLIYSYNIDFVGDKFSTKNGILNVVLMWLLLGTCSTVHVSNHDIIVVATNKQIITTGTRCLANRLSAHTIVNFAGELPSIGLM
jgi:hypothetical protein